MKIILVLMLLFSVPSMAHDTYVRGYEKSNGTYVEPHYRTAPNNTVYDNYSTKGNVNPYTGQPGTKNPDSNRTYNSVGE
jgi:hypothetical protein